MDLDHVFNHPHFPKYYKNNREDWQLVQTDKGPVLKLQQSFNSVRNTYKNVNGRLEFVKTENITDSKPHFVCIRLDSAQNLILFGEK